MVVCLFGLLSPDVWCVCRRLCVSVSRIEAIWLVC